MAIRNPGIKSVDQKWSFCYNSSIVNKKELEMSTYQVTYTVYERGSSNVLSEGTIPIQAMNALMAENTVKLMFQGGDTVIRYVMG
jgi:hypothetical protein